MVEIWGGGERAALVEEDRAGKREKSGGEETMSVQLTLVNFLHIMASVISSINFFPNLHVLFRTRTVERNFKSRVVNKYSP